MKPLITVITLTYRKFDGLKETIESVCAQKYSNIEYYIVDDGSDEFDAVSISKYLRDQNNLKHYEVFHWNRNLGTVASLNEALKYVHGKYIIPLSCGDTFYSNQVINDIVSFFEDNPDIDIVTGKRRRVLGNNCFDIVPSVEQIRMVKEKKPKELFYEIATNSFISGSSTSYSFKIIKEYAGFDERFRLIEDFPFYARALLDGKRIGFLNEILINYDCNGVTSKGSHVSGILLKDRLAMYRLSIFPYLTDTAFGIKRRIYYSYVLNCFPGYNIKKVSLFFLFPDLVCLSFINKVIRRINKPK